MERRRGSRRGMRKTTAKDVGAQSEQHLKPLSHLVPP